MKKQLDQQLGFEDYSDFNPDHWIIIRTIAESYFRSSWDE